MHQFCLSHVTGSSNSGRLEVFGLPAFVQSVLQVLDLHTRCVTYSHDQEVMVMVIVNLCYDRDGDHNADVASSMPSC